MKLGMSLLLAVGLSAQLKLPPRFEELSKLAEETVDVTLDGNMLRFAERMWSGDSSEDVKIRRILRGLNSIYVRTYEFKMENVYSPADLDEVRAQLRSPDWSRIVEVRDGKETSEIYARTRGSEIIGLTVLAAEPKELTIVQIDGPINLEDMASLSGRFGLPRLGHYAR